MPEPIRWKSKIILFKLETTYATDSTPAGANAIYATEVRLTPMEGNDVSRELELPYLGAQGTIPAELHAKLSFRVELEPSGTAGVAPAWGPLLRACAVAETIETDTSVTYNPVSNGHESGTLYLWIGSTRYVSSGVRGNCMMMWTAQGIPYLQFELTGLFTQPSEQTRPTPVLAAWKKPRLATSANTPTFTLNEVDFVLRSFQLNLGNEVENRFLIGAESIVITDKQDAIECTVEAQPLSDFNPFSLAAAQTEIPVELVHGTGAGRIATLDVPAAQMQRPQGLEGTQNIKEWPLRLVPLPTAGNDQWTLVLT